MPVTEPAPGNLAFRWTYGSNVAAKNRDPRVQVVQYNEDTFVLRQNVCVHWEAPFTYLLFGNKGALLIDSGATAEARYLSPARHGGRHHYPLGAGTRTQAGPPDCRTDFRRGCRAKSGSGAVRRTCGYDHRSQAARSDEALLWSGWQLAIRHRQDRSGRPGDRGDPDTGDAQGRGELLRSLLRFSVHRRPAVSGQDQHQQRHAISSPLWSGSKPLPRRSR